MVESDLFVVLRFLTMQMSLMLHHSLPLSIFSTFALCEASSWCPFEIMAMIAQNFYSPRANSLVTRYSISADNMLKLLKKNTPVNSTTQVMQPQEAYFVYKY